jgi:glycosyltransferase 2 family protein
VADHDDVVVRRRLGQVAVAPSLLGSGLAAVAAVAAAAALVLAALAAVPRLRVWLRAALGDLRTLLARGAAPAIVVLSVAGLAGHLTLFAVAARAVGVETGLVDLLPLLVVSLLAMVVPIGVGGWGPREATAVLAFGAAGHGAEQGLAVAVAFGVLSLVSCLPGVLVLRAPRC